MYIDEVKNILIKATNAGPEDEVVFLPPSSHRTPSEYFVAEICDRLYVCDPVVFVSVQSDEADLRQAVPFLLIFLSNLCALLFGCLHCKY
jgi:hypothetical protein